MISQQAKKHRYYNCWHNILTNVFMWPTTEVDNFANFFEESLEDDSGTLTHELPSYHLYWLFIEKKYEDGNSDEAWYKIWMLQGLLMEIIEPACDAFLAGKSYDPLEIREQIEKFLASEGIKLTDTVIWDRGLH